MIGRQLAHYEILSLLGRGGMGEVYRARDARLGREVAIKVLPQEVSADSERLARFAREARTLAALQHPNVASIYGFEEVDGVSFLVMELVEGEDLAVTLRKGALPLATALEFAHQITEGLEAAHDKGIVHRDLKPANVKLTSQGSVKILDFGLARAAQGEATNDSDLANSPTITAAMTQQGTILGTAAYMSPEQARGGVADARADIWAFGVVLWEMLTGQRLFEGETVSDTLASVLKLPPDWSQLPASTPPRLRELLERCLAKKRRDRLASIADARLELEWLMAGRDGTAAHDAVTPARSKRGRVLAWALPLLLLAFFAGHQLGERAPVATPASHGSLALSVAIPPELVHLGELLAPDGSCLAVRARLRTPTTAAEASAAIYIRPLDREEFQRVEASLGLMSYSFSADSKWIGMVAPASSNSAQMRFWRVPVDGSAPPTALFNWSDEWSRLFLWLPDGDLIVDLRNTRIQRIPTDGRPPAPPVDLTLPEGITGFSAYPRHNSVLPDGRHLVSWTHSYATGRYDQTGVLLDLVTGEMSTLLLDTGALVYWPTGHLLFGRSATLLAVEFDVERLEVRGSPVAVASGMRQAQFWDHPPFELSRNGILTYYPGHIGGDSRRFAWLEPDYSVREYWSDDERAFDGTLFASSEGDRLIATIAGSDGYFSIWNSDLSLPSLQLWIEEPGRDRNPVCLSPDGRILVHGATDGSTAMLFRRDAQGIDTPVMSHTVNVPPVPACLVDDNATLLFTSWLGSPAIRMLALPPVSDPMATPASVDDAPVILANASNPAISFDGRWLAYDSDVSGRHEVYVRAWLGKGELGPTIRVSRGRGRNPQWYTTPGGDLEVRYFLSESVYRAAFDPGSGRVGTPELVTDSVSHLVVLRHLADGRILGLLKDDDEKPVEHIGVRVGFGEELSEKLRGR